MTFEMLLSYLMKTDREGAGLGPGAAIFALHCTCLFTLQDVDA